MTSLIDHLGYKRSDGEPLELYLLEVSLTFDAHYSFSYIFAVDLDDATGEAKRILSGQTNFESFKLRRLNPRGIILTDRVLEVCRGRSDS